MDFLKLYKEDLLQILLNQSNGADVLANVSVQGTSDTRVRDCQV